MKKRESSAHCHDDSAKPDSSMVDIVVRITQHEMFGENLNFQERKGRKLICEYIFQ